MRRFALLALLLSWAFIVLLAFAPLAEATVPNQHQSSIAQLNIGGNIFDQIDSLYNNVTKRLENINPIPPQQASTPSVKIGAVRTTGAAGMPQVTVTLQNGQVALDGVRVDVIYRNTAGANVSSDSSVLALTTNETRSVTFTPTDLPAGSYSIGVVVYKNGTDPSNQATPPYDTEQDAATLAIASPTPAAAAGNAGDPRSQTNNAGGVLTQLNAWVYFVIAITALITIALFFVFSQNRLGDDRYEEDHFRSDDYPAGGNRVFNPPPSNQSVDRTREAGSHAVAARRPSRRIDVNVPDSAPEEAAKARANDPPSIEGASQFDADGFVVGDVTSKKALRDKIRGKRGA